jgi:hypothetical protein
MDARSRELSRKAITLYSKRGEDIQNGRRQHSVHIFDHLRSIDYFEITT